LVKGPEAASEFEQALAEVAPNTTAQVFALAESRAISV
jgi:hypothetical protein